MNKCENCEIEHEGKYGSGRFCSNICARSFSSKINREETNKKVSLKLKKNIPNIRLCSSCNENITNSKKSKYCKYCKPFAGYLKLFEKFNINENNLIKANIKLLDILNDLYFVQKKPKMYIMNKYGVMSNTLYEYFKLNNIKLRDLSDAMSLSYLEDRSNVRSSKSFRCGYHTTWDNKTIYYRSSYELEYAQYLDKLKIKYEVEKIRIQYFDKLTNKPRIAIPDFLLIDTNTIVEIKSEYTYDKENMLDKKEAYLKNGFNFKLILDKKEVEI